MRTHPHPYLDVLLNPWAVTRTMLAVIATVASRRLRDGGSELTAEERAQLHEMQKPTPTARYGSTAVIPVYGVVMPRANLMADISGGTSFQALGEQLRAAVADPKVQTIVFDIDSPGGNVAGATEFAREVLAARAVKPIIAQANFQMCSAAYWIAAAARQIIAAPSASVGSIGVYAIHDDLSKALGAEGVTRTYVSAGKYKLDGNPDAPLTDHALAAMQARVDAAYDLFVTDVSRGRGVEPAKIRTGYAEGAVVNAEEALALGMVDRIGTLEETLARVTRDTPQEPLRATGQDRAWLRSMQRDLLQVGMP